MPAKTLCTAGITGVGKSFPEKRLTNADLEKLVETNDQWIVERTGIKERRMAEPGTGASVHGAKAALQALEHAGVAADEIDMIIVATVTPDMPFPATACIIQEMIGATKAWGFDLEAACSGFLFALQTARGQVESGLAKKVLVIGTEVMTAILDFEDRNSCILFGDGAGAVVVEPAAPGGGGFIDALNRVDGSGAPFLYQEGGGSVHPASVQTVNDRMHYIHQQGREVFKFAVKGMTSAVADILAANGLTAEDVSLFVPHQANIRIIEAVQRRLDLKDSQVIVTIAEYGNTTAATIPTALREAYDTGRLKEGDLVVLAAFGAGFTWGASLFRWTAK